MHSESLLQHSDINPHVSKLHVFHDVPLKVSLGVIYKEC